MPGIIGVAVARGYHYQGGVSAFGLAVMAGLIAAMASIALALIIASSAKNDTQAMLSGTVLAVPLGSMTGVFMPIPRQFLGEFVGEPICYRECSRGRMRSPLSGRS
ncbi:MAG: ABC transporter permease [Halobacteriota archaeon]